MQGFDLQGQTLVFVSIPLGSQNYLAVTPKAGENCQTNSTK